MLKIVTLMNGWKKKPLRDLTFYISLVSFILIREKSVNFEKGCLWKPLLK